MPARKTKPKLRPKLTPAQVETITRVWLATANASEAARQAKCSEGSARKYILRARLTNSHELYAQALERAEQATLAAVEKGRRKAAELLGKAKNAREANDALRALNDSLRAVNSTRVAHAKVTGAHAPEKHRIEVAALSDAELDAELERLATQGPAAAGEGASAPAAPGETAPGDGAGGEGVGPQEA